MTKYRKGSMGAADEKSARRFCAVATVIYAIMFSMVFFNFPHTNLYAAMKATPYILNVLGFVGFLYGIFNIWYYPTKQDTDDRAQLKWAIGGLALPFIALGLACIGGL